MRARFCAKDARKTICRERGATWVCVSLKGRRKARGSLRGTPFSVYRCQHTKCPIHRDPVSGLYYIEYALVLEDHSALALQEGTGHLGGFPALDQAVPFGWALRRLAELDEGAALQRIALGELHHVACTASSSEGSTVSARRLGCLTRRRELLLLRRRSTLGGVGEDGDCAWAGGV